MNEQEPIVRFPGKFLSPDEVAEMDRICCRAAQREAEELRQRIAELEGENGRLRALLAADLRAARTLYPDTDSVGSMSVVIGRRLRISSARIAELESAIERSGFDIQPCLRCGLPTVTVPGGQALCDPCIAQERADSIESAGTNQ